MPVQFVSTSHRLRITPLFGVFGALLIAASILLLPFPINFALVPAAAMAVLLSLHPALAPIILTVSVPMQEVGATAGLSATKLALGASLALSVIFLLTRQVPVLNSRLYIPFGIYLIAMAFSLRNAVDLGSGLAETYRWVVALFALWLGLYAIRSQRAAIGLVALIGAGVLFEVALGLGQSLFGLGSTSFAVDSNLSRAFGTFGKPNSYAGYLELTGPMLIALAFWAATVAHQQFRTYRALRLHGMVPSARLRRAWVRSLLLTVWLGLTGLLSLLGLATSFSRGGWMGISAGLLAMMLLAGKRAPIVGGGALILVGLVLGAGGMNYAPAAIRDRYEQLFDQMRIFDSNEVHITDENFAAVERMAHWQTGLEMFKAHPISGVGIGNFNERFNEFAVNPSFPRSQGHAHNYYIHSLAETGAIGLAAYVGLVGSAYWICLRAARRAPTGFGRALGLGATGVTTALIVHNVVENLHVLNLGIQLSMVWALAIFGYRFLDGAPSPGTTPAAGSRG